MVVWAVAVAAAAASDAALRTHGEAAAAVSQTAVTMKPHSLLHAEAATAVKVTD